MAAVSASPRLLENQPIKLRINPRSKKIAWGRSNAFRIEPMNPPAMAAATGSSRVVIAPAIIPNVKKARMARYTKAMIVETSRQMLLHVWSAPAFLLYFRPYCCFM